MISPEILRYYPFFAGIEHGNLIKLANLAQEQAVPVGHYFFYEREVLNRFFLAIEGAVGVVMELPAQNVTHAVSDQFTGNLQMEDVVISALGPGEVFGWSGLVAPHEASAGAKALTPCRVIVFDGAKLTTALEEDCTFGYMMMQKVAGVISRRLRDVRIESLAGMVERVAQPTV